MDLRQYLDILRRQKWLVIEAVVLVAVAAGVLSNLRTPVYESSARVLLRPNDPAEELYPGNSFIDFADPDRYVAAQIDIIQSEGVAKEAAKGLKGYSADELLAEVRASQVGMSDMLDITGSSIDPEHARDVANAFARAYIENRRQYAVEGLERAADDIGQRLTALEQKIAEYDAKIGDGGLDPTESPYPENEVSGPGIGGPTPPAIEGPTPPMLDDGALPTSDEALKAARYAAASQYQSLFFRQQELLVDINLKRGYAEMISTARVPTDPVSPKPVRDAMLGAFLGLLLGLGAAFVREQVDDRIRSREEVERATGLTVIADVPFDEATEKEPERLAVLGRPLGPLAESIRSLRTSLAFLGVEQPLHRIVVTSPGVADGKSVIAANLAAAYAQAGFRTVLVSSDLRRPRLDSVFSPAAERAAGAPAGLTGLITRLAGSAAQRAAGGPVAAADDTAADVAAALVATGTPNLWFLPAGTRPPNPAELLASRHMTEVLEVLSAKADVVILDAPPLLAVTDAAVLAAKADGVVIVSALGETHRGALGRARASLGEGPARALGVVLNKVEGGRGYYGYADSYRYEQYYVPEQRKRGIWPFRRRRKVHGPLDEPAVAVVPDLVGAPSGSGTTPNGATHDPSSTTPTGYER